MVKKKENSTNIMNFFFLKENFFQVSDDKKLLFYLSIPIFISLAMKLILATSLFNDSINNDGMLYITAAKHYASGEFAKGLSLYPMPAYPLLLAFVHFLIPNWIISGHVISIVSMVLATLPLYFITKTLFNIKPAFWACMLFAFLPEFNQWALYISRDSLFLFVFGSCIYLGLQSFQKTDLFLFILTFIFTWASILIRIEGVLFIFLYFCALMVFAFIKKELRSHFILRILVWVGIPLSIIAIISLATGTQALAFNRFNQVFFELCKLFNGSFAEKYYQIYDFFSKAENHAPFSGWKYNFASMTKHYMLIIYLIGIITIISKIIFPLSCIPLVIGLKSRITFSGIFLLCQNCLFILLVFYSVLTRDFIVSRFLMVPAFLLLPWIGLGLDKLYKKIRTSAYKKIIIVFIAITVIAPSIKSFNSILHKGDSIPNSVQWIVDNIQNKQVKIVTNSEKTSFYFKLEQKNNIDWRILFYDPGVNYINIEKVAKKNNANIIILKMKNKNLEQYRQLKYYQKIKSFYSRRYATYIYAKIIEG